jgi:hypothetical protein
MGEISQSFENKSSKKANTRSSLQNQSGNTANQENTDLGTNI